MPDPTRRQLLARMGACALAAHAGAAHAQSARLQSWPLVTPARTGIHDVAPAPDDGVWFTAQASGHLGWFDPKSGRTELVTLGRGSSPHGVIQGPDRAAWITDSGLNAIMRVARPERSVRAFALPEGSAYANLNTAALDGDDDLWFTGQSGVVGKLAVKTAAQAWRVWRLPGDAPRCNAVYVDERDIVWASDFGGNAVWRFDPAGERFERFGFPRQATHIRQILGRPGEVRLPESGTEHISVIRTA